MSNYKNLNRKLNSESGKKKVKKFYSQNQKNFRNIIILLLVYKKKIRVRISEKLPN